MHCADRTALVALRTRAHPPALERAAIGYARVGEYGALFVAIALVGAAVDAPRRGGWLAMVASAPLSLTANYIVKLAVKRDRPKLRRLKPLGRVPSTSSFPSGHAATSFAAAAAAPALRLPLMLAAAAMSLTRPYLGVHYPSDIVGGALLGSAVGLGVRGA